jgi:hypothetical protein
MPVPMWMLHGTITFDNKPTPPRALEALGFLGPCAVVAGCKPLLHVPIPSRGGSISSARVLFAMKAQESSWNSVSTSAGAAVKQ